MTQTTTNLPQAILKEDLLLKEFVVSDVRTFKSKKDQPLISVTLVGKKKYTPLPASLYFGKMTFEQVQELIGQTVAFTFSVNDRGLTVQEIFPS